MLPFGSQIQIPCIPCGGVHTVPWLPRLLLLYGIRTYAAMHAPEKSLTVCYGVNACASQSWASETCYIGKASLCNSKH